MSTPKYPEISPPDSFYGGSPYEREDEPDDEPYPDPPSDEAELERALQVREERDAEWRPPLTYWPN